MTANSTGAKKGVPLQNVVLLLASVLVTAVVATLLYLDVSNLEVAVLVLAVGSLLGFSAIRVVDSRSNQ